MRAFQMQPDLATSWCKIRGFPNASRRKTKSSALPTSHPPRLPLLTCTTHSALVSVTPVFCTATLFLLSGMLCSLSDALTPNQIPSVSSGKPSLTSLTGPDHPGLIGKKGTLLAPCIFLSCTCHCSYFNLFGVLDWSLYPLLPHTESSILIGLAYQSVPWT